MKLFGRFVVWIGGATVLTVVIHSTALLTAEARHVSRQAEEGHWANARHLAHACGTAAINRDELAVLQVFKGLAQSAGFIEAACVDAGGVARLHSDVARMGKAVTGPRTGPAVKSVSGDPSRPVWTYIVPVDRGGAPLGTARLAVDGSLTTRAVRDQLARAARRSVSMTALALGVAVLLSGLAARGLTRPIAALARGARRLGRGEWDTVIAESGPGELGELAREFNAMSRQLGELDRLKDQVMHSVSHDLRNPLGAMTTLARMLKGDGLPEPSRALAEAIETSSIRLAAMLNNILDTARLKDGPLPYHFKPVAAPPLCAELDRLYRPMAEQAGKTLEWTIAPDAPVLRADEEKLFRILLNLLTNAFKFTREGDRITVSVEREKEGMALFRVADTGWGIAPEQRARLFEPYRAVKGDRPGQGTGLGLPIVKALVEGHGGALSLLPNEGGGTVAAFTIPTAEALA